MGAGWGQGGTACYRAAFWTVINYRKTFPLINCKNKLCVCPFFFLIFISCNDAYFCVFLPKLVGGEEQSCSLFLFDSIFHMWLCKQVSWSLPQKQEPQILQLVLSFESPFPQWSSWRSLFLGRCSQALEEMMPLVLKGSFDRLRKLENLPFRHINVFNEGEGNSVKCSKKGVCVWGGYKSFLIKETN